MKRGRERENGKRLTSLHIRIPPETLSVVFPVVGDLLREVVVSVLAVEVAGEKGHDVEEVGVVDLEGDVAV
jgi:hypothetical protein